MNPTTLQKIVADAINQNVFENWRFYLLLISLAVLTTILSASLEGRGKKKGETAAIKEDLEEIKRQLAETTKVTKTVETAILRGDWIQREKNILGRTKLEAAMRAAFTIVGWARDNAPSFHETGRLEHSSAIDDFRMLTKLYLPEMKAETAAVLSEYAKFVQLIANIKLELIGIQTKIQEAQAKQEYLRISQLREKAQTVATSYISQVAEKETAISLAVDRFADASYKRMDQLTSDQLS
jgi:hypothetical protein